jgi:autotransporter-associated beta strand protein
MLAFNRSDNIDFSNSITGTGGVALVAPSVVTLSGANTFSGPVSIPAGATLKVANNNSLGATAGTVGAVTVASGGTLDIGAIIDTLNYGTRAFHISGTGVGGVGAIYNSTGTIQTGALHFLTLDGDATVNGSRIDVTSAGAPGGLLDLQGHTLTANMTAGANHIFQVSVPVTAGNMVVTDGSFGFGGGASVPASGGTITFNSGTTASFVATAAGSITRPMVFMGGNSIGGNNATLATVDSPMILQGNVSFTPSNNGTPIATSNNPLVVNGDISESGGSFGVTKTGVNTTTLNGNNTYTGPTNANQGRLVIGKTFTTSSSIAVGGTAVLEFASDGSHNHVLKSPTVSIAAGARLDLKDNKLITDVGPGAASGGVYGGIQGEVQRAYNFNAWDQPGLTTSMPDALAGLTTIGVSTGEARGGLGPTDTDLFAGQTITGASTIAMYTYAGDANLDGVIDGGDYGIIDNFVQVQGADSYFNGDFNYDGVIDGGDYGIIDNNIQAQGAPFPVSGSVGWSGVTAVPEPSACGFAIFAAAATLLHRRRRQRA